MKCRSCGAEIRWAVTPSGKAMPVDPDPARDGNVKLTGEPAVAHVLSGLDLAAMRESGGPLHKTHFATCPNAASHRKRGAS